MSGNIISEVLDELPKEIIKQTALKFITIALVTIGAVLVGGKSYSVLFPYGFSNIDIFAKLDGRVQPGETIELYPPSRTNAGEVSWELPFNDIADSTIELHRLHSDNGKLKREILLQQKIGENPLVLFVLEK